LRSYSVSRVLERIRLIALAIALLIASGVLPGSPLEFVTFDDGTIEPAALDVPDAERPGVATVRVLDLEGHPIAGAIVRALFVREGTVFLAARVMTGSDGVALLEKLPIGAHWLIAEAPLRARASTQRFVGPEPVSVELRLGAERPLQIEVRDELARAIVSAEVEVRGTDPLPRGVRTGKDGVARASGVGVGPLRVTARAPGYEAVTVSVGASDTRIRVVLRRLGAITVAVVDREGKGVEGATVTIAGGFLAVPRTTNTDSTGTARIAGLMSGSYDIRATKGMLVSAIDIGVSLARGADAAVRLVLGPGRMVRARVIDDAGAPIAKAEVVLAEGGLSPFPFQGTTDSKGEVIVGPIAPGAAGIGASADGFVPRGPIAVGSEDPIVLTLRRAATLIGDVRDTKGAPIDGATIEVVGTDLDGLPVDAKPSSLGFKAALLARAQGAGRALLPVGELGVVPGPVPPIPRGPIAFAKAPGGADPWVTRNDGTFRATPVPPGRLRAIVRHPAYVEAISAAVAVEPGGEGKVTVVLLAGGRIVGRVRDEKGFAVAGAYIEIAARAGSTARGVRTATDGVFVLAAVPGEVSLALSPPDKPNEVALRIDVEVAEGTTKELELVLPSPRPATKVRVLDDRRYPIKGAQVTISSLDPKAPVKVTAFTDDRGEAEVQRVAGLHAQLEVQEPGYAVHRTLHDALPTVLEVELAKGIVVTGVIYAPGGRVAFEGATVSLIGEGGVRRAVTDKLGKYAFRDVPRGDATVEARAAGTAGAKRSVVVAMSGSRAEMEIERIELAAAGVIEGTVVDEKGRPVAGARVAKDRAPTYIPSNAQLLSVALTDATGAFKLVDVPVGEVELEAFAVDVGRGRVEKVRVDEGRTTPHVKIVVRPVGSTSDPDLSPGGVAVTLGEAEGRVFIAAVAAGSEAERAGILEGDEIRSIDGAAVATIAAARSRLSGPLGADVIVIIHRKGAERSIRVVREPTKK
jgi:protocatechuate 3,4-dioxygenase beta subunit